MLPPSDTGQSQDSSARHSWVVATGTQWTEAGDATQYPTTPRTASPTKTKNDPAPSGGTLLYLCELIPPANSSL